MNIESLGLGPSKNSTSITWQILGEDKAQVVELQSHLGCSDLIYFTVPNGDRVLKIDKSRVNFDKRLVSTVPSIGTAQAFKRLESSADDESALRYLVQDKTKLVLVIGFVLKE
eukprot:jgi/Picsp_1/4066/NSC_01577-R1_---NA---